MSKVVADEKSRRISLESNIEELRVNIDVLNHTLKATATNSNNEELIVLAKKLNDLRKDKETS
jgi:hypothetical protein